jgi:hypothetical protein
MPKNFTCDICNKCFNTTQHLLQHKNKKKPCEKVVEKNNKTQELVNNNNYFKSSSGYIFERKGKKPHIENIKLLYEQGSHTKLSSLMKMQKDNYNSNDSINTSANNSIISNVSINIPTTDSINTTENNSSTNNNSDISSISFPGLIDVFMTYKNVMDENKKLTYDNAVLIRQINELKMENLFLKKQYRLVESFIINYQELIEGYHDEDNNNGISSLTNDGFTGTDDLL